MDRSRVRESNRGAVSLEDAETIGEQMVMGIARGVAIGYLIASGIEPPLPSLHMTMEPDQKKAVGKVLRPLISRMGGLGTLMQIAGAGIVITGTTTAVALGAHPAGSCPGCQDKPSS